jgi:hypothetical protein
MTDLYLYVCREYRRHTQENLIQRKKQYLAGDGAKILVWEKRQDRKGQTFKKKRLRGPNIQISDFYEIIYVFWTFLKNWPPKPPGSTLLMHHMNNLSLNLFKSFLWLLCITVIVLCMNINLCELIVILW